MPPRIAVGKLIISAILMLLAVVATAEVWQVVIALVAAGGAAAWAARDLLVRVRLAADEEGLTLVSGLARRRRLSWSQVDRVRVDARRRSRMLEVDVGETLYLFSRYDLDADLDEIATRLEQLRTAAH